MFNEIIILIVITCFARCIVYVMELSSKSKAIKKRKAKKKKILVPESVIVPLIKPDAIDGVSNWMLMQKTIEPAKEPKKRTEERMFSITSFNEKSRGYKPPFSNNSSSGKNQRESSHKKYVQIDIKDVMQKDKSIDCKSSLQSAKPETINSQYKSYKFDFNESNSNSPDKKSGNEARRNKYGEKKLTKAVAMDCEMVGTGPKGEDSIIARVSIVNSFGVCLYDEFVKPKEKVTDFRTKISGVRPSDLKRGKDLFEVQKDVLNIIEGRILVGHAIKHDLDVLFLSHPRHLIRDTAFYKPFRDLCGGKTPSLKKLASVILGCDIQSGEHSSIEDAQAAMLLYLRMKKEWEKEVKSRRKKRKSKIIESEIETKN